MRGKNLRWTALFAALLFGFSIAGAARADSLKIGGTGFGLGVVRILAEKFEQSHPEEIIIVVPSLGSSGGIKALLSGALDLSISGRPLKKKESGQGISAQEIVRSPFCFVVNKNVAKEKISPTELEKIFRGETSTWDNGKRIRLVLRPKSDTVTKMMRKVSTGMDQAVTLAMSRQGMIRAITDQESAERVEKTPGALTALTLTQLYSENRQVGILAFNGIEPTVKGLSDGTYPLFVSLYLVTPLKMRPGAQKFLAFIYSDAGTKILTENGNMITHD
jgi:phosphate transport system substrate-binding protein